MVLRPTESASLKLSTFHIHTINLYIHRARPISLCSTNTAHRNWLVLSMALTLIKTTLNQRMLLTCLAGTRTTVAFPSHISASCDSSSRLEFCNPLLGCVVQAWDIVLGGYQSRVAVSGSGLDYPEMARVQLDCGGAPHLLVSGSFSPTWGGIPWFFLMVMDYCIFVAGEDSSMVGKEKEN